MSIRSSAANNESAAQRPSGVVPKGEALAEEAPTSGGQAEMAPRAATRPSVNVADVDYLALEPRDGGHPMLASVYETWRDGWRAVLRDLASRTEVRSNDFTRQDIIGVLWIRGACAAITALRFCDLSQPMWLEDTYFESWPSSALARLGQSRLCISSNTLIAPEWRGARVFARSDSAAARASCIHALTPGGGLSIADPTPADALGRAEQDSDAAVVPLKSVLFGLAVQQFVSSSADLMVGVSRNDRSMDRLARDHGAQRIGSIDVHGIESDICLFEKASIPPAHPIVEDLWSRQSSASWFPALEAG